MNNNNDDYSGWIAIVSIICFLIGGIFGYISAEKDMKKEAVSKGHAAWVADKNGDAEFQWKSVK